MNALLRKEMRLSASVLSYLFIAFGLLTLTPGYPILCGAFLVTLGLFHTYQNAREANDILFSALLPVAKTDVVKGKYIFTVMIELCGFIVMAVLTLVRMTVLSGAALYRENTLMNANPFFLGMVLIAFGLFNWIFVGGFFKTGYKFSKPFITYMIAVFLMIGVAETLHHLPGLGALNAFGFDDFALQMLLFLAGVTLYIVMTYASYKRACSDFENIDL